MYLETTALVGLGKTEGPTSCASVSSDYLSKLRRDSVGADFQSVRRLTNYVCAKPPESSKFNDIRVAEVTDIRIT